MWLGRGENNGGRRSLSNRFVGGTARTMRDGHGMWADNAQRERIFEMIGTQTGTLHRAPGARADHPWPALVAAAAGILAVWLVLSAI